MADNYIERQYEQYQARKAAWEKSRKHKASKKTATRRPEVLSQSQVKKVVAVHDLSGVGRVSLMAVIPVLSSMGFQVCPLTYRHPFQSHPICQLFFPRPHR